jgi:hypothetical protein
MINKMGLPLFSAGLFTATVLFAPCAADAAQGGSAATIEFSAQQQQEHKGKPQKAAPAARPAQPRVAPQRAAPQRTAPRVAAPQRAAPRTITQPKATSRVVRQPKATSRVVRQPKATSRTVTQPKATSRVVRQPKTTPKTVAPAAGRKVVSPAVAPRVVTPRGARTVTASRLRGVPARGAGRAVIRGQNYSVWRSGYRVRHGSGWRTFVALSALGAIVIGSSKYYPYAYISAPEPYCEGLTEDGCQLMWQEVETIEGDVINQCVAYCPWQ